MLPLRVHQFLPYAPVFPEIKMRNPVKAKAEIKAVTRISSELDLGRAAIKSLDSIR
jgi:hypothetical protein